MEIQDRLFIGGRWVEPTTADTIAVVSPFTETEIGRAPAASKTDVDRAVAAAREAFENGPWPHMPLVERIEVLQTLRNLLAAHHETAAQLISMEMGCPISQSRSIQATAPIDALDSYLSFGPRYPFRTLRRSAQTNALVSRAPVGVVAAVSPWNVPLAINVQKVAPALLAGCTFVLKPSPETPFDAYLLVRLLEEAGVPPGVVNLVPADRDVSEYLVTHPGVDKVTFTGSSVAGRRIASLCGQNLRPVTLELGGKSAAVILDDADLDATIESLRFGSFRNSGQVCSSKTRILVSSRRQREVVERLVALADSFKVGDPSDSETYIGPMVTAKQRERVEGYIAIGKQEGATVVSGGGRPAGLDRGWFVEPTVFTGVEPGMRIAQEEIFGPVISVITYETEDQAVAMANDSDYGLNGAVYSADTEHALGLAARLETGTVEVNGNATGYIAPMGGFKASGLGRENAAEGMEAYTELKSVGLPRNLADALAADAEASGLHVTDF